MILIQHSDHLYLLHAAEHNGMFRVNSSIQYSSVEASPLYSFKLSPISLSAYIHSLCLSELVEYFRAQMRKDPDMASAVAAIRTLLEFLKRDKGVFLVSPHL